MYTQFCITNDNEDGNSTLAVFRFNGSRMAINTGNGECEIPREELESLVDWLRCGLEKMNRDKWDAERAKSCACDCVRPA